MIQEKREHQLSLSFSYTIYHTYKHIYIHKSISTMLNATVNVEGIVKALNVCSTNVLNAFKSSTFATKYKNPTRLVAVSKIKPVELLRAVYDQGHRHFGENYVKEICEKAPQMPDDTNWHFIGHLQSNKCNALVKGVPSLYMVETVDTVKLANKLNNACENAGRKEKLKVMIQVNTSGEDQKSGCQPNDTSDIVKHVLSSCNKLDFAGLMTIGVYGEGAEECFEVLVKCREQVANDIEVDPLTLELSMGMSGDFASAIAMGSTNVRCGSTIFGARDYSKKK